MSPASTQLRTRSSLDISNAELEEISREATKLVFEYFDSVSKRTVVAPENFAGKTKQVINAQLSADGVPLETLLAECRTMFDFSRHNGHPRFFGYVASPSTPVGAYSDLIASTLNANITCWRSGPAGTEIEQIVIAWLGELIGYDKDTRGLLTSGGSMANLIALLVASRREGGALVAQKGLWSSGPPQTVYASKEVHMSIAKAADILGFGRDHVRMVECDERLRLNVDALRAQVARDLKDGFRPFCVVASAGTVNTGAVDPLEEVATVAREFDLWFHIDGAYGAPGVLDSRKAPLFRGLNLADSLSLDPHKWLYVPIDAGCLLFRDETAAKTAFSTEEADYIKVHGLVNDETFAYWDYGIELSRRFRALKVWMTLRYYGARKIAHAISEDIALAEYLGEIVKEQVDFELLAPVELSICCFRYVPKTHTLTADGLNRLNEQILTVIQKGGQAYVSNATVHGKFGLRACITNFRTTKEDIDKTIEIVRDAARRTMSGRA